MCLKCSDLRGFEFSFKNRLLLGEKTISSAVPIRKGVRIGESGPGDLGGDDDLKIFSKKLLQGRVDRVK